MKLFQRIALWTAAVFGGLVLLLAILVGPTLWRVLHGVDRYETVPPTLPADLPRPAILIFSKTNGFRDDASIAAATAMFRQIGKANGWSVVVTENGAAFNPAQLSRFDAVVWNSVSGDVLTPAQRQAFKAWLEGGGGFVGVHGAGGDPSYRWRWYVDELIGAQFIGHTMWPHEQPGTMHVEAPSHPVTAGLPVTWKRREEWYSFDRSVRAKTGYQVLVTVDEATYQPHGLFREDIRMGADHPLVWAHCVGRGRAVYSALGHFPASYAEPLHRRLLTNAVDWAASLSGGDVCRGPGASPH
jgi:type 1 glutamine amidotransferase